MIGELLKHPPCKPFVSLQGQNISLFSLELHVQQREGFAPDPTRDPIIGIFYSVFHDDAEQEGYITGVLWNGDIMDSHVHYEGIEQVTAATESDLFPILVQVVRRHDPDILVGYDIQPLSWGYILERADAIGYSLASLLSRVPGEKTGSQFSNEEHWWSMSEVKIVGRTVLNLWRILRHEMALRSYTFENVMYHFLNIRLPEYSHRFLSELALLSISRPRFIHYYQERVERPLDLIRDCNILNRTVEMAKLYGIQFYDVLSRGSQEGKVGAERLISSIIWLLQFRVENMMLRMTRRQNYVAPSPSPQQRSQMASPKMIALTMEPISRYYKDPVVVLDFTSLYPSICIAYNICYSTCLGKIEKFLQLPGEIELGCLKLGLSSKELRSLKDDVHVTPAGVAFVQKNVRRGVIPSMLEQILETRAMIKRRMKENKKNKELLRVLDARQLALKLIANVTYGYTSANFSGRMPCVEIADSIVHQARETLENAIKLVNSTEKWGATVVYGDTDSLFVHLPGKSKAEAFIIGEEMIRAVGDANPEPINLKFEKVYQPCFLQTKKRYAGYAYETPDQIDPILDAKGIESVRRDGCPVASKILETSLKVLFENRGRFDPVKMYLSQEISKVLSGRMSLRNFLIAREFRGRGGYKPGAVVPALKIARARSQRDPRSEPQMKERVAYVISAGPPGATLYSCVREPEDFIRNPSLKVNYGYYVRGQIVPAMNRMFNLMGQDVSKWLEKMPHDIDSTPGLDPILPGKPLPPSRPFAPRYCPLCEQLSTSGKFCLECQSNPMETSVTLRARIQKLERKLDAIHRVCMACTGSLESSDIHCISMACPMYLKRAGLSHSLKTQIQPLWTLLDF